MNLLSAVRALAALPPPLFWAAVGFGAFVEYVFPPFPGDAVVVAGTAVAVVGGGSVPAVFAATTLGALLGAAVDLAVGRRLARTRWEERLGPARAARVRRIVVWFERWGAAALLVNRFVPGVRALFFVAAGVAGIPTWRALLAAAGSALAWNALLVGAGSWVGWNLEALATWTARWSALVGVGLAVAVAVASVGWWRGGRLPGPVEPP
jgi:membrane protein DedA with SNARE-associated domain